MVAINPDLDWYTGLSKVDGVSPHCPYANVHKCPRYYHSLRLLSDTGMITSMSPETIQELDTFWKGNPFVPVIAEHETSVWSSGKREWGFKNFCPEVSFDRFGLFADNLYRYADEIDAKSGEAYPSDHWRRVWASRVTTSLFEVPAIFTAFDVTIQPNHRRSIMGKSKKKYFEIKPGIGGIKIDIKALFCWITKWFHSRYTK